MLSDFTEPEEGQRDGGMVETMDNSTSVTPMDQSEKAGASDQAQHDRENIETSAVGADAIESFDSSDDHADKTTPVTGGPVIDQYDDEASISLLQCFNF